MNYELANLYFFSGFFKFYENLNFFEDNLFVILSIQKPSLRSLKKLKPARFSRFDVYLFQTNR